ncbi:MAG: iron-containing alcohol dehydrogenase [Oscillospiraceae bacterium]|nr:iron-containing alcohol dehydrogenase [Oscillospiraceae bacterium]
MASYVLRKTIRRLPGVVIKAVPKPHPEITEGFQARQKTGEICRERGYQSCLIVTDQTLFSLKFHEIIVESLEENGIKAAVFHDIHSEPTVGIVEAGEAAALACGADCVIALGGGSVLDASKMIVSGLRFHHLKAKSLMHKFLYVPHKSLPMISVPSTAGTGAEITVGAVIKKSDEGAKGSTVIVGLNIVHVILDSELTVNAPAGVTAACGIDALSHGLEGVVASVHVPDADMKESMECVRLVLEHLPIVLKTPDCEASRLAMSRAALYGGNAINEQLAGYVHAFAHAIGAQYHIPHGAAIALSLLPVMRYQKEACLSRLAELAVYCGLAEEQAAPETAADNLMDALDSLIQTCDFPDRGAFIPQEDYPLLIKRITDDSINYSAPVVFSRAEISALLDEINGRKENGDVHGD